jgi:thiamine biosynthesis lipoprotein
LAERDANHLPAARAALDEADRVEALLTVFRESSELSRINREMSADCASRDGLQSVPVSEELFTLLLRCRRLHADTGGAFDVTSSPLSRCWGFLYRQGRVPGHDEVAAARALVGMEQVAFDSERRCLHCAKAGMALNLGAIGKGYALDRMADILRTGGVDRALLSAGGSSVLALGGGRAGWPIDVRSPLLGGARVVRLRLRNGALGTSGAGEQFVIADGTRYGHVIDPRTGQPASGVVSCSVATADAATADALSTAFLVGGLELAQRYCDDHPDTLALMMMDDGLCRLRTLGRYSGATVE